MKRRKLEPRPQCPYCGRTENQARKGFNATGTQRCRCNVCGVLYTENPKGKRGLQYPAQTRELAIRLFRSGKSSREVGRALGIGKNTVLDWIKRETTDKVRNEEKAHMYNATSVGGCPGGDCFLLETEQGAVLVDSGFGFSAGKTVENIAAALGGRPLDYILLTHSHYDHVLGSPAVKERYPGAKVVASGYAANIMAKESARAAMAELHTAAAANAGWAPENESVNRLAVDIPVEDGHLLPLGTHSIRVVATPGHTNCCVSYYFVEENLLAAAETLGVVLDFPHVIPCFLSSYRDTVASIARAKALAPAHLLGPHTGMLPDDAIAGYFESSLNAVEEAADFIRAAHQAGQNLEEILSGFKARFYTDVQRFFQPEAAFDVNSRAMTLRLLSELGEAVPQSL